MVEGKETQHAVDEFSIKNEHLTPPPLCNTALALSHDFTPP